MREGKKKRGREGRREVGREGIIGCGTLVTFEVGSRGYSSLPLDEAATV